MPPERVELGPHHEPLSWRPVHTQYGPAHVGRHVVRERHAPHADRFPAAAGVVRDVDAAVVAVHDVLAVRAGRPAGRVDPDRVVVHVTHALEPGERLAAVGRLRRIHAGDVDRVRVVRIAADLAEVHRPLVLVGHERPRLALVGRAPDAVRLRVGHAAATATASAATTAAASPPRPRRAPPRRRCVLRRLLRRQELSRSAPVSLSGAASICA